VAAGLISCPETTNRRGGAQFESNEADQIPIEDPSSKVYIIYLIRRYICRPLIAYLAAAPCEPLASSSESLIANGEPGFSLRYSL
jgi:hypothetical protein